MADNVKILMEVYAVDEKKANEFITNKKLLAKLLEVAKEANTAQTSKLIGGVLQTVATKLHDSAVRHRPLLLTYVVQEKIKANQVQFALDYLKKVGAGDLDVKLLEQEAGVGVNVSEETIKEGVANILKKYETELAEQRYRIQGTLFAAVRNDPILRFAEGKSVTGVLNNAVAAILGPKTEADSKPLAPKPKAEVVEEEEVNDTRYDTLPECVEFHDPKDNTQLTLELLAQHLAVTGGGVRTRFPPEPNGFLHIGHAKSMNLNFGYAKKKGGHCFLRFDDTNPAAEKLLYIENIIENVHWLGHTPYQVTYSSDNFPKLYELAVQMIKSGHGYVCIHPPAEISANRANKSDCSCRNRPIEESVRMFEDMRKGKYDEGTACLRMKADMKSDNPCMRDMIAYRIKYLPHPHVGDKWCIYPSYDFTHCICDSLENITHSLCTLEFAVRRESYNWLLNILGLYRPPQIEFSRLCITNTVLSKRKLLKLVEGGYVSGWDDPRLLTLNGLRRRGYTPAAINAFCEMISITRNENLIELGMLEYCCRQDLDEIASRKFVVVSPLKLVIVNYPEDKVEYFDAPNHPRYKDRGTRQLPFSRVVYIDRSDFELNPPKEFYRLAPGRSVGLRFAYNVTFKEAIFHPETKELLEVHVTFDSTHSTKQKVYIQWVAEPTPGEKPLVLEVRLYGNLFKSQNPGELDDWLNDMDPKSLEVIPNAFAEPSLKTSVPEQKFQFERVGFFSVDNSSTPSHLVANRTVTLKDTYAKIQAKSK